MLFSTVLVAAFVGAALAAPADAEASSTSSGSMRRCRKPAQRKSWHKMSSSEKRNYIEAEKCVMALPATLGLPGPVSAFDELASTHQIFARFTHGTGTFLPYHRYLLHAHEVLLRRCGLRRDLGIPYWNETADAGRWEASPIFDDELGFGGNGTGPDLCIGSGPFAGRVTPLGPGFGVSDHCVQRNLAPDNLFLASQAEIDKCHAMDSYRDAHFCFYLNPHFAGHAAIGGTMVDPIVSPSDPVFYLHHAFVDKLWWDWQAAGPADGARLRDMSGPNIQTADEGFPEFPGSVEEEGQSFGFPSPEQEALMGTGQEGDDGGETTLDHVLKSLGVIPDATIRQVMDIKNDYLCYEYVQ